MRRCRYWEILSAQSRDREIPPTGGFSGMGGRLYGVVGIGRFVLYRVGIGRSLLPGDFRDWEGDCTALSGLGDSFRTESGSGDPSYRGIFGIGRVIVRRCRDWEILSARSRDREIPPTGVFGIVRVIVRRCRDCEILSARSRDREIPPTGRFSGLGG